MAETPSKLDACRRCGHVRREHTGGISQLARRVVGRKPARVECGEPTDLGWACPCRSRYHAG